MRYFLLITATAILAGCSSSNIGTDFQCPINQEGGCLEVSDGDDVALRELERGHPIMRGPLVTASGWSPRAHRLPEDDSIKGQRTNESLTSLWIGSFVDESGNYHPPSEVYIVIKPAEWIIP